MRIHAIVFEVFANIRTGTSRTLLWCIVAIALLGASVLVDVVAARNTFIYQRDFLHSGSAAVIVESVGAIDADQCLRLAQVEGVRGAFVSRIPSKENSSGGSSVMDLSLRTLPGANIRMREVYGDFLSVFGGVGGSGHGIGVPSIYGTKIGYATMGAQMPFNSGAATVGSVFSYPSDGRDERFSNVFLVPVPSTGMFDECVFTVWPANQRLSDLAFTVLREGAELEDVLVAPLNSSLGEPMRTEQLLADRYTRWNTAVAAALGLAIGALSVRARRLEFAFALSIGVPKKTQIVQVILETVAWVLAATAFAAAVAIVLGTRDLATAESQYVVQLVGLRCAGIGLSMILGAALAVMLISKRRVYDWFKER